MIHPDRLKDGGPTSLEAEVPGNVELDMQRAGRLEDPYGGSRIGELKKYELYEWWYEKEFETPVPR